MIGHEIIEVSGKKPDDEADIQANVGNTNLLTRDEFGRGLAWSDRRDDPNGSKKAEEYWKQRPQEWEQAWQDRLTSEYTDYRTQRNVGVHKSLRLGEAAANVGEGIGWVTVGAIAVFGGGELALAAGNSAPAASLGQWANSMVVSVMHSAPKLAVATVGYGVAAPPGAPDLPGPLDDLGRWGRQLFSKVVRDLDGAPVLVSRPEVQANAGRLIDGLFENQLASQRLQDMVTSAAQRWPTGMYTRRSVILALQEARQLIGAGQLPDHLQPAYDWLMGNFTKLQ